MLYVCVCRCLPLCSNAACRVSARYRAAALHGALHRCADLHQAGKAKAATACNLSCAHPFPRIIHWLPGCRKRTHADSPTQVASHLNATPDVGPPMRAVALPLSCGVATPASRSKGCQPLSTSDAWRHPYHFAFQPNAGTALTRTLGTHCVGCAEQHPLPRAKGHQANTSLHCRL